MKRDKMGTSQNEEIKKMDYSSFAMVALLLAGWIILNRWVLPWMGVPTCMGGCCSVSPPSAVSQELKPGQGMEKFSPNDNVPE
jgi:hypothetical protein